MIKIMMHGCNGKMGRMITEIVKGDENAAIVAGVDAYTAVPNEYPVFDSIDKCDVDVDVVIDEKDIRIDVMRASGNGGQCVNTTDSAVRLTHFPTGIVIYSQTEKSQLQNKEKAFRLLRSKLYDLELEKQQASEAEARRSQIGTGDRSEKIRTYNFPQGRVTDHRIKLTLHKLDSILNGDLDEIIDSLIAADQTAKLAKMEG